MCLPLYVCTNLCLYPPVGLLAKIRLSLPPSIPPSLHPFLPPILQFQLLCEVGGEGGSDLYRKLSLACCSCLRLHFKKGAPMNNSLAAFTSINPSSLMSLNASQTLRQSKAQCACVHVCTFACMKMRVFAGF